MYLCMSLSSLWLSHVVYCILKVCLPCNDMLKSVLALGVEHRLAEFCIYVYLGMQEHTSAYMGFSFLQ